jgi:hypothetical protein
MEDCAIIRGRVRKTIDQTIEIFRGKWSIARPRT